MSNIARETLVTLRNLLIKNHKAEIELLDKQIAEMDNSVDTPVQSRGSTSYPGFVTYNLRNHIDRAEVRKRFRSSKTDVSIELIDHVGVVFNEYGLNGDVCQFKLTADRTEAFYEFMIDTVSLGQGSFLATLLKQADEGKKSLQLFKLYNTGLVMVKVTGMVAGTKGRPTTYYYSQSEVMKLDFATRIKYGL